VERDANQEREIYAEMSIATSNELKIMIIKIVCLPLSEFSSGVGSPDCIKGPEPDSYLPKSFGHDYTKTIEPKATYSV
jgi:hypothetical protein